MFESSGGRSRDDSQSRRYSFNACDTPAATCLRMSYGMASSGLVHAS